MARGRKPGKRTNKTLRVSIPKRTYYVLLGVAGNNQQRLNRLVKLILEEKLANSTIEELERLLESKKREESAGEGEVENGSDGNEEKDE